MGKGSKDQLMQRNTVTTMTASLVKRKRKLKKRSLMGNVVDIKYGHWSLEYCDDFEPEDHYGFIYMITNENSGKSYIGKKQFLHKRSKPPLKGKKNKRISYVDSGWKTYTGSCNPLNYDIELNGKDNFTFEILTLCSSKSWLCYEEASCIIAYGTLIDGYNGLIPKVPCPPR